MIDGIAGSRPDLTRQGQRLEYFTVAWNSVEALVSIVAGIVADSVALIGFGLDSAVEVASGAALLWRLHHDLNPSRREQVERTTLRFVGWCFIALAAYILHESASTLIRHEAPERSIPGILIAAVSVVVMPMLAKAKRRVATEIKSGGMQADSRQTEGDPWLWRTAWDSHVRGGTMARTALPLPDGSPTHKCPRRVHTGVFAEDGGAKSLDHSVRKLLNPIIVA